MVQYYFLLAVIVLLNTYQQISAGDSSEENFGETSTENNSSVPQDLYVIKTIVYEVGILTDADNNTDIPLNDTQEQVDVSFFNPTRNGSVIDLSSIPVPIQTNVSGVAVTGILPANFGSIVVPPNGTAELNESFPILPNKQIKVTHNISTANPDKGSEILSNLPEILGLSKILGNSSNNSTDTERN